MTIQDKIDKVLPLLKEWEKLQKSVNDSYHSYYKITYCSPESPMWESVHNISEAYTNSISKIIGDDDTWLPWYQFDNDMGRHKLSVTLSDTESVTVDNLEKLAYVICWQ